MQKEQSYELISALVKRFEEQLESYKRADYNETLTRQDFINPFFKALGWDIDNSQGFAEAYREVIHEDRVKIGSATKAPDYSFRLSGGKRLFFVEAKKPSVVIKDDTTVAYQIRRYGWSAKLALSIITDFEEFAVYDCTKKPSASDKASTSRIKYLTFKDYLNEFDYLWNTFSKESVLKGGLDRYIANDTVKKGTTTVDKEFLNSLDTWRTDLASNISKNNKLLNEDELNFAVQQTIDRIIFLRIAEDRSIEQYGALKDATKQGDIYKNMFSLFLSADEKYNSGLFDLKKDKLSKDLIVENKILKKIINELYYPESPYEFSVLSVEILGSAYEQFLGKTIRIDKSNKAKIEEKPEVRKAGGVYYTPQYIVDYIVRNTVGKLIENKSPKEIELIKILDPACGSGSFLIGAYQYLIDYHKDYYFKHETKSGKKESPITPEGNLTSSEKKRILLNNIYGVDIDTNAVEVTKLSLLLKCMEGENESTIAQQYKLWNERILPTLDNNIKSGNSLIDTDFYDNQLDFGEDRKIKPFNWLKAFPEVFKRVEIKADKEEILKLTKEVKFHAQKTYEYSQQLESKILQAHEPILNYGNGGFDVVIGNPPYVRQELLGDQKAYFSTKYTVFHGMADLYSYFIEKGIGLLKPNGLFGIIVANKWMRANYGEPLRKWLKKIEIQQIIDFGDLPVFQGATTYPCILLYRKNEFSSNIEITNIKTLDFPNLQEYVNSNRTLLKQSLLEDNGWNLSSSLEQDLLKKIQAAGIPLGKYVEGKIYYGIKTGLNEAFVINDETKNRLIQEDPKSSEIIKPFLVGKDIKRFQPPISDKHLIFFPKGFTKNNSKGFKSPWRWVEENYPAIANYLLQFEVKAKKRCDQGDYWWELRACDYYGEFEKPKICWGNLCKESPFNIIYESYYINAPAVFIPVSDLYLLGLVSSSILWYFLTNISAGRNGGYIEAKPIYVSQIPIRAINSSYETENALRNEIIRNVEALLKLNKEKQSSKLQSQLEQLQSRIDYHEQKINESVYALYNLTDDEIKIIESQVK